MDRQEFIKLIGSETIVDYPSGREMQIWYMGTFNYDCGTDTITHNRLDVLCETFLQNARNPRYGTYENATHG